MTGLSFSLWRSHSAHTPQWTVIAIDSPSRPLCSRWKWNIPFLRRHPQSSSTRNESFSINKFILELSIRRVHPNVVNNSERISRKTSLGRLWVSLCVYVVLNCDSAMRNQRFAFISVRNVDYGGLVSSLVFIYIGANHTEKKLNSFRGDERDRTQIVTFCVSSSFVNRSFSSLLIWFFCFY